MKDKLGRLFATSVVETTSRIAAMCLGVVTGSSMSAVVAYSIVGCAISIYFVAWVLRLCGSSIWSWLARHKWYFLGFGAAYAVVLAIDAAGSPVATLAATLTVTAAAGLRAVVDAVVDEGRTGPRRRIHCRSATCRMRRC